MRSGFIWLEHGVLSVGERKMAPGGGGGETLVGEDSCKRGLVFLGDLK